MRLIDADKVLDGVINPYERISISRWLDVAPTVDAVQVVHGKWYKPSGMMPPEYAGVYRCSECDGFAIRDWKSHKQVLSDFCPHCGARMEDCDD